MTPLQIPAPPTNGFNIFGLQIHFYALTMLSGILVAAWWGQRRFVARGGDSEKFQNAVFVSVIFGIIGARLYHIITDYELYFLPGRNPIDALKIWQGGLGIWGAIGVGGVAMWVMCRRQGLNFPAMADVLATPIMLAHMIARFGNYWNQELFGRPTGLPWGLYVDPEHRPPGFEGYATFHPTFLYEMIWTGLGTLVLIALERRFRLGRGKTFVTYVVWYTFGRFFVEALRIDPANHIGGFRVNNYVSLIVFVGAVILLIWMQRTRPGARLWPFGGFPKALGRIANS